MTTKKQKTLKPDEIEQSREIIIQACTDIRVFTDCFFRPRHVNNEYNKLHLDYFKSFYPHEHGRHLVIQAARGAAKTTLICLIDVLYRVCYGTDKYILILSSTKPLAVEKTTEIVNEINENDLLRAFYGIKLISKKNSKQNIEIQTMAGRCSVRSQGFQSQIRGTKYQGSRPSRIICDDIIHGTRVFSEVQREKEKRIFYTDVKMTSEPSTSIVVIGTPLHNEDVISTAFKDPTWESKKYPAIIHWPKNMELWGQWEKIFENPKIDKNDRLSEARKFYEANKKAMDEGAVVLWPDREDLYYLMVERYRIGRRAFNAEKQLQPFVEGESLFQKINFFEIDFNIPTRERFVVWENGYKMPYNQHEYQFYYALDPGTGEMKKINSSKPLSQSARVCGRLHVESGVMYIYKVIMDRNPQSKIIKEMVDLHVQYGFTKMAVEKNLYRDLYIPYMRELLDKYNKAHDLKIDLPITSVYAQEKKEQRIYSLEPAITTGKIMFDKYLAEDFITQLKDYPNCDRNDGLDALEILMKVSNPYNKLRTIDLNTHRVKKHRVSLGAKHTASKKHSVSLGAKHTASKKGLK